MHPARTAAIILLSLAGVVWVVGVAIVIATRPNVDTRLSAFLLVLFGVLLLAAVVAIGLWLRNR